MKSVTVNTSTPYDVLIEKGCLSRCGEFAAKLFVPQKSTAAIITDAVVRLIPGAIGDEQSALSDSFQDNLLAPPVYTRPADYNGWKVPEVLLSGHQRKIEEWRLAQAQERTARLRPDLLK